MMGLDQHLVSEHGADRNHVDRLDVGEVAQLHNDLHTRTLPAPDHEHAPELERPANLGKTGLADSQHGALQALTSYISAYDAGIEWEMTIDKRKHGWRWRAVQADQLAPMPGVLQRGALNRNNHVVVRTPLNVSVHEALTVAENEWLTTAVKIRIERLNQLIAEYTSHSPEAEQQFHDQTQAQIDHLVSAMMKLGVG